jgi:hypothetical protein
MKNSTRATLVGLYTLVAHLAVLVIWQKGSEIPPRQAAVPAVLLGYIAMMTSLCSMARSEKEERPSFSAFFCWCVVGVVGHSGLYFFLFVSRWLTAHHAYADPWRPWMTLAVVGLGLLVFLGVVAQLAFPERKVEERKSTGRGTLELGGRVFHDITDSLPPPKKPPRS